MKNYLILFGLLFSIFIIPSDVFAAGENIYIPYYNKVEDFDIQSGEGENIKNILYNQSVVEKSDNDKCVLFYEYKNSAPFVLLCSPSLSNLSYAYSSSNNNFFISVSNVKRYRFDSNYLNTYSSSNSTYIFTFSNNSFENVILYSDVSFKFNANSVDNLYFYDLNDSTKIYGQFNTTDFYTYEDFYLTEPSEEVIVFQDNDIHTLSKLILGESISEEFSFVYTISDYLIILIVVGALISPIAVIIKFLRW